ASVQRPVWGGECSIEEEWFSVRALPQVLDGVVSDGIRHIEAFARGVRLITIGHLPAFVQFPVAIGAADEAKVFLESTVKRPVRAMLSDVPLAGHHAIITGGLQRLRDGDALVVEFAFVAGEAAV